MLCEQELKKRDAEIERLRGELATLGVAAKAALEQEEKRKSLEKEVRTLRDENKTLNDNYNSERVSAEHMCVLCEHRAWINIANSCISYIYLTM